MRHLIACVALALACASLHAQETSIPPRFQALAKDGHFRLKRILGTPEMPPAFNPTTAFSPDGKRAVYVEDLTTGADDMPRFRARVHVWDVQKKPWPREIDIDGKNVTALALSASGDKA